MITLRRSPYEYRRRLPHYQKSDRPLFVTFRKLTAYPLPPIARTLVLEHCLRDNGTRFTLYATVIMPEHVHMLFTPLRDQDGWPVPAAKILQSLKVCPLEGSINCFGEKARSGRTSPSIMCFARMRASQTRSNTSGRIQSVAA